MTRTRWGTLSHTHTHRENVKTHCVRRSSENRQIEVGEWGGGGGPGRGRCATHSERRKELRQVKTSRGSMAHNVITLLNLASSTLRCSAPAAVQLVGSSRCVAFFRRLVKYWSDRRGRSPSIKVKSKLIAWSKLSDRKWCHTMVAVMKKFHGSNVPKPSMKKISQTPKYLGRIDVSYESPDQLLIDRLRLGWSVMFDRWQMKGGIKKLTCLSGNWRPCSIQL